MTGSGVRKRLRLILDPPFSQPLRVRSGQEFVIGGSVEATGVLRCEVTVQFDSQVLALAPGEREVVQLSPSGRVAWRFRVIGNPGKSRVEFQAAADGCFQQAIVFLEVT